MVTGNGDATGFADVRVSLVVCSAYGVMPQAVPLYARTLSCTGDWDSSGKARVVVCGAKDIADWL